MKKAIVIYVVFCVSLLPASAETGTAQLAEKLYKEQNYDSALVLYSSLLDTNTVSPSVFYNLGNCYYKTGDPVSAILYYEKCLKYEPSNEDAKANIDFIRKKINNKTDQKRTGISGWIYAVANGKGNNYWSWATLVLVNFGFLSLIILRVFRLKSLKNAIYISSVLAIFLSCFTFYLAWYQKDSLTTSDKGIIFAKEAEIKSSPSDNSTTLLIVKEGAKVSILNENENWLEISIDEANRGWIKKEELKTI